MNLTGTPISHDLRRGVFGYAAEQSTSDAAPTLDDARARLASRDVQARGARDREALSLQPAPEAHGSPGPALLQRSARRRRRGPRVLIGPIALGAHRREVRRAALLRRRIQRQHPRGSQPVQQRGRRHLRHRVQRLRLRHRRARAADGARHEGRVRPGGNPDPHRRVQARQERILLVLQHDQCVHRDDRTRRVRRPRRPRPLRHRRRVHRRRLIHVLGGARVAGAPGGRLRVRQPRARAPRRHAQRPPRKGG